MGGVSLATSIKGTVEIREVGIRPVGLRVAHEEQGFHVDFNLGARSKRDSLRRPTNPPQTSYRRQIALPPPALLPSPTAARARPLRHVVLAESLRHLPDAVVEDGQRLRDEVCPQFRRAGPGLYVLHTPAASGAKDVETELLLSGRKIRDYTCACGAFAKTHSCAHLAALLALTALSKLPKAVPRASKRPRTVTTETLLERVPENELRSYLLERARHDGEAAAAIRLAFAHHAPVTDRFGPTVRKLLSRKGGSYTPKEVKRIGEGLRHFARLREEWRASGSWLDLLELTCVLTEQLTPALDRLASTRLSPRTYVEALLDDLLAIAEAPAAPALIERLDTWLERQMERGAYFRQDLDGGLYAILRALPHEGGDVLRAVEGALERFGESLPRLRHYRTLLMEAGRHGAAEAVLLEHLDRPGLVLDALAEQVAAARYEAAAKLCAAALDRCSDIVMRLRLLKFYQALVGAHHDVPLVEDYAAELYLHDGNLDAVLPEGMPQDQRTALLEHLRDRARLAQRPGLEVDVLDALKDWTSLEELLYRHLDRRELVLDVLPRLAGRLPVHDFDLILQTGLGHVLAGRFGVEPAADVVSVLDGAARRGQTESVARAVAVLRTAYLSRPALQEAITEAGF